MTATETRTGVKNLILSVGIDEYPANPLTDYDGMWTLVTFCPRGYAYDSRITDQPRDDYFDWSEKHQEYLPNTLDLFWKLRAGLAFTISRNRDEYWPNDPGDMDGREGVVIFEHDPAEMGAKTPQERHADAAACLKEYSEWAQGNVYCYSLRSADSAAIDESCCGFIGADWFTTMLRDEVFANLGACDVKVKGDAADLVSGFSGADLGANVRIVDAFEEEEEEATLGRDDF